MSKQTGIVRPLGLALLLAIGFGAVYGLAAGWGISIWEALQQPNHAYENLVVRADGTPLIERNSYGGYQNVTFHALDGREVPDPKQRGGLLAGTYLPVPGRAWTLFPLDGNARVRRFADGQTPPNLWYFLDDGARARRGYFVGYQSQSKLCVGFIGRDGFRPDQPPVEQWFPMDGAKLAGNRAFARYNGSGYWYGDNGEGLEDFPAWKVDMISGTEFLEVDLRTGSVTTLMESPDLTAVGILETVSSSQAAGEDPRRPHRHQHLAARTTDRVLIFDAAGKQSSAYLLPEVLRERDITFYELDAGKALVIAGRLLPDHSSIQELFWIDTSGKVSRQAEATLAQYNRSSDSTEAWTPALIVPAPLALGFLATVAMPLDNQSIGLAPNYSAALAHSLAVFWPVLLAVTLLAAALAGYCLRRHRRYAQPAGGAWFVFVLLLGLPGLVAYLFHRRWPVLEKCPACGQAVPRDREVCARCGAAFPPPEPKGCEVFA